MKKHLKTISIFIAIFLLINIYLSIFCIPIVRAISKIIIVPDNYPTIQEAINAAKSSDVIYVKVGTYLEHIVINKTLWLIGEDPNRTIIDGRQFGTTVTIKASKVLIRNFMITGGGIVWGLLGQGIGIGIYDVANCTIMNNIVISNRMGIHLHSSSNIIVSDNVIMNNREGMHFYNSSYNSVIGNDIVANQYYAIHLFSSNSTQIIGNNIMNNSLSICIYASSNNNTIFENSIVRSGDLILSESSYNNISKNVFIDNGLYVLSSYKSIIKDNIVNGKPLIYLEEISAHTIKNAGQIILVNCKNVTIEKLELSKTGIGIELWQTNNTIIIGSNMTNNQISIYLYASFYNNISENILMNNVLALRLVSSSSNIISRNNIAKNGYGIVLDLSSYNNISRNNVTASIYYGILILESLGNLIYNNEFIDNAEQVFLYKSTNIWDGGYPSGGNYWSDYTGTDLYDGIGQNETGSDSIGDKPYYINNDNIDRYPLMKKFKTVATIAETPSINYNNVIIGIVIMIVGLMLFLFIIYNVKIRFRKKRLLLFSID